MIVLIPFTYTKITTESPTIILFLCIFFLFFNLTVQIFISSPGVGHSTSPLLDLLSFVRCFQEIA